MSLLHPTHHAPKSVDTEPTEIDELSERVLALIRAYSVDAVLDAGKLQPAREHPPVLPGEAGYLEDGIYHVGD